MNHLSSARTPSRWSIGISFLLLYVSWGTTYLAIQVGVRDAELPPALFGGVRVLCAGLVLLLFLRLRVGNMQLPRFDALTAVLGGFFLFVGGNGLLTAALGTVPSGVAAVLGGTTPLWIGVMEALWPRGDRLTVVGWLGLLAGVVGVLFLFVPDLRSEVAVIPIGGLMLVMGSNLSWALGSVVLRHRPCMGSHLTLAAYQMVIGGGGLTLIGVALGETQQLTSDLHTPVAWGSFLYLLLVGSLTGFVAFNYLLKHVSAPMVATYAYVNPMIAILVGWGIAGENLTGWTLAGMAVILGGVMLVRKGTVAPDDMVESGETTPRLKRVELTDSRCT